MTIKLEGECWKRQTNEQRFKMQEERAWGMKQANVEARRLEQIKGGKVRKRKGKRWRKEERKGGRKEVEEGKIIGSESRNCNEKGLMNGGGDKRKKRGKKQGREKRKKKVWKRREEKRDRTRSKRERQSYVGSRLTKTTCAQTCSIFLTPAYGRQGVGQPPKYHPQKKNRCVSLSFLLIPEALLASKFLTPQKRNTLLPKADNVFIW